MLPYQGSKRLLAPRIGVLLQRAAPIRRLYEPFCGSAAITLHALHAGMADSAVLGDALLPLVQLWQQVAEEPQPLARQYRQRFDQQAAGQFGDFRIARDRFNATGDPADFLWLCARCVKNAVRFGPDGRFNQSADLRRRGTDPARMERHIAAASAILNGRCVFRHGDWLQTLRDAGPDDVAYLDPPYAGTSESTDPRYFQGLPRDQLVAGLRAILGRGVRVVLSYDGRTGAKQFAEPLPADLGLVHVEIDAGRSAQATLLGRQDRTFESLYVSESLMR